MIPRGKPYLAPVSRSLEELQRFREEDRRIEGRRQVLVELLVDSPRGQVLQFVAKPPAQELENFRTAPARLWDLCTGGDVRA